MFIAKCLCNTLSLIHKESNCDLKEHSTRDAVCTNRVCTAPRLGLGAGGGGGRCAHRTARAKWLRRREVELIEKSTYLSYTRPTCSSLKTSHRFTTFAPHRSSVICSCFGWLRSRARSLRLCCAQIHIYIYSILVCLMARDVPYTRPVQRCASLIYVL